MITGLRRSACASALVLSVAGAGLVAAPTADAKATTFKAALKLSPSTTTVGTKVTASLKGSVAKGDHKLGTIRISWGDKSKVVSLASFKSAPTHRYTKAGKYTVKLVLRDRLDHTITKSVTEVVKAAGTTKPTPSPSPTPKPSPTTAPSPSPTPSPSPSYVPPLAGSYSAHYAQTNSTITFYVSPDRTKVLDVSVPTVSLACSPNGQSYTHPFTIASAPIGSDGSFTATATAPDVLHGYAATMTYTVSGTFHGPTANPFTGQLSQSATFNDGVDQTCTTGVQTWTAAYDAQGAQTGAVPPVGSYTAGYSDTNSTITYYVSQDQHSLQDLSLPTIADYCAPAGSYKSEHLVLASIPLAADGSFSASGSSSGVVSGHAATITVEVAGSFHDTGDNGVERAAGTVRETLTYTDSAAETCTSGLRPFYAERETQGAQTGAVPPVGSYSAHYPDTNDTITYYVSQDQHSLQDVSLPTIADYCAPAGGYITEHLLLASVPLAADGSFTATASTPGVVSAHTATITSTLTGNVHNLSSTGIQRMAGTLTQTVTYTDSTAETCTSGLQPFTALRETQGDQSAAAPAVGSYSSHYADTNNTLTLYVSADQHSLQDVSVPSVADYCTPGGSYITEHFLLPSVPLASDGSFTATTSIDGIVAAHPATITSTLTGNVHNLSSTGIERLAGTLTQTVTYTDSSSETCSTGLQPVTALRDSQGTQSPGPGSTGAYSAHYPDTNSTLTFSLASDSGSLQNVAIPSVADYCTPGGSYISEPFSIASVPVGTDGSFTATATASGTVSGHAASFTYVMTGNFHGLSSGGVSRAAGTLRETVTYTDSAAETCSTGLQGFLATHT